MEEDAHRRHTTSRLEIGQISIITSSSQRLSLFLYWGPKSQFPWGDVKRNRWYLNMWWVELQERTLGLRKLESLYRASGIPTCCSGERHHLYLPRLLARTHSWKYSSEKRQSVPLISTRPGEIQETNGELSSNTKCHGCYNKATIALKVKNDEEWPRMTKRKKKDYDQTKIYFRLTWLGFPVVFV